MRNQAKTIIFTLAVLLGFILSGISISLLFENWFIDATPQHRYTLSQASRHLAANLSQPLNVRLYYSPKIADNYPETAQYFNDKISGNCLNLWSSAYWWSCWVRWCCCS